MAASLFTEEDQLAAVSKAAGGYERGQEKEEGRQERCALFLVSRGWVGAGIAHHSCGVVSFRK